MRSLCVTGILCSVLLVAAVSASSFSSLSLKNVKIPAGSNADDIVQQHSFMPPLLEEYWSAGLNHWDFGQAATVTDNYVRLTPSKQSREGFMWNDIPSHLTSWSAYLKFRIHSGSSLGGDGFAMWYTDASKKEGGSLFGHPENPKGLGIIFDTFDNNGQKDNPGVSVILGDGHEKFRTDNDLMDQRLGGCTFNFRNSDPQDPIEAVMEYSDDTLTMSLFSHSQKQTCFSIAPITLPDGYYFGLTAHTGQLADSHDVHHFVIAATAAERAKELEKEKNMSEDELKEHKEKTQFSHSKEKSEKEKHRFQNGQ